LNGARADSFVGSSATGVDDDRHLSLDHLSELESRLAIEFVLLLNPERDFM
jgi:hypothetical protein